MSTYLAHEKTSLKRELAKTGFDLICRSHIALEPLTFSFPTTNWVFFSSPKAIHVLASNSENLMQLHSKKIGVLGAKTEKVLEQYGLKAEFVGGDAETKEVGKHFAKCLSSKDRVTFFIGNRSLKQVQQGLDPKQYEELICYQTKLISTRNNSKFTFIHVSSPSQAVAVQQTLSLNSESQIIAQGKSTENELVRMGFKAIFPQDFSDASLLNLISKILV
ncbi:MAG: uroporphyrinogen-III synthase [Luteibaculum sp.]